MIRTSKTPRFRPIDKFLKPMSKPINLPENKLCSALTTKGAPCSRSHLANSVFCRLHLTKHQDLADYVNWLQENNPQTPAGTPDFLIPYSDENYPPNQSVTIYKDKPNRTETLHFYGMFQGHRFSEKDLRSARAPIKKICCIHDANHSMALFLKTKDDCQFAFHNYIPFVFPGSKEFVLFYTQKYDYPLVISEVQTPANDLLVKNGVHKAMGRWCTRIFKMNASYWFYRHYDLNGVVQYLGITNDTPKRAAKYPEGIHKSALSEKKKGFIIYNYLPIRNFLAQEQEELIIKHGLPTNPIKKQYGSHGCVYCPMRSEKYYHKLREWFPSLYNQCIEWKKSGSTRSTIQGKKPYLYYPNSKIM